MSSGEDGDVFDAVVIGGGFYGTSIACYLAQQRGFRRVALIEREASLLARASYNNQARVHNGYHYPRSFTTAFRSRVNYPRFLRDHAQAVRSDSPKLYAIARGSSKVTARQFERFCAEIGAQLEPAPELLRTLFDARRIETVYRVQECVFNASLLAAQAAAELRRAGVSVLLGTRVLALRAAADGDMRVECAAPDGNDPRELLARYVFNCAYSGLNQLRGDYRGTRSQLKHELAELALVRVPLATLGELGITVMDGPFFSLLPFPARGLHTLSHVRYTPHLHFADAVGTDPYARLASYDRATRFERMMRDVSRYLPAIQDATYVDSLFEIKTVLIKNESDDGRPILFERHSELPRCYSVLGGKLDNVYDVLEKLDAEALPLS